MNSRPVGTSESINAWMLTGKGAIRGYNGVATVDKQNIEKLAHYGEAEKRMFQAGWPDWL